MKNNFKLIIFCLFAISFISASNAANGYLYTLVQDPFSGDLVGCSMDSVTGKLNGNCHYNDDIHGFSLWRTIAAHPRSPYLYISEAGRAITVCAIHNESGTIYDCKKEVVPGFDRIVKMAIDPLSRKQLYYIAMNFLKGNLLACKIDDSGMHSQCRILMPILKGEPSGLALSADGSFVYVTTKKPASVLIWHIQEDGTLGANTINSVESQIIEPDGIVIDPTSNYAYIIDDKSPRGNLVSCKLIDGGSALGACKNYPSAPGFTTGAKNIILSADGYYSYISYPDKHKLVKCSMTGNGVYENCTPTDFRFDHIGDIAYH